MSAVALESTVIAHGLPYPQNVETAQALEAAVREEGAEPYTVGLIAGEVRIGLSAMEVEILARTEQVRKVSLRDLPIAAATKQHGATTVAATMHLAHRAGIRVFSTGGIGGVHRSLSGEVSFDMSNDLEVLGRVPLVVVCAGAKAILDLPATLEVLETRGVTVVGYQTEEFPAFYSRASGLPVDVRCDSPEEVALLVQMRHRLGVPGATLVCVPVPEDAEIPAAEIAPAIQQALTEAEHQDLRSGAVTPFVLSRITELTKERSLRANLALLENNARVAARIAVAIAAEKPRLA